MTDAYLCDAVRTPIGRYGGSLAAVRPDDLAAVPLAALKARNPGLDWALVDDLILGCANQAGEDNRNVARMAGLLAGLGVEVPGGTINRLCGSGMDAVGIAARAIKAGEAALIIAGQSSLPLSADWNPSWRVVRPPPRAELPLSACRRCCPPSVSLGWRKPQRQRRPLAPSSSTCAATTRGWTTM